MKKTIPIVLIALLFTFCSQEKKLLRNAANAVERSEFEKAVGYYDQVITHDTTSFFGNAGKGIVLSEFMARHEQAIPYLERALKNTPDKTKPILNSNLGKSYHFVGNYERALFYYGKSQKDNDPKWADYDEFLSKRISDCKYAIEHPKVALPENQSITNVGTTINTDKPEYTPVAANGKMYFTSKRQDTEKEKKNGIDGRYFEAIYTSTMNTDGTFTAPERYTLPRAKKGGEAIMSITPDGQKMFLYQGGKIYESDPNSPDHKTEVLDETINFANLQNHAALSPDGQTLYFTSESDQGRGGSDIYMSKKGADGKWGDPIMLDYAINSQFDEESPYVNEAGTLFFSSNGHPGYGGFDVYKSSYVNGAWTKPENLGQPVNSPGDDMYFTLGKNSSKGYYASARPGGYGDLDIYKVHYVSTETTPCQSDDQLTIVATPDLNNPLVQTLEINVPESYRNNVRSYRWDINGAPIAQTTAKFQHTFPKAENYKIGTQLVVYCDSCPNLIAKCAQKDITIEVAPVLTTNTTTANTLADSKGKGKNKKDAKGKSNVSADDSTAVAGNTNKKDKNKKSASTNDGSNSDQTGTSTETGSDKDAVASNNDGTSGTNGGTSGSGGKNKKNKKGTGTSGDNSGTGTGGDNGGISGSSDDNTYVSTSGGEFLDDSELKELNWNNSASYFDYNTYNLKEDAKAILDQNIGVLKSKSNLIIVINGYADSRGSDEYNKQLSLKRANSVKQYFTSHGISNKRIKSVNGLGEEQLLNDCTDDKECDESRHQENRRVQLQVVAGKGKKTISAN